jgi:hypothetical protein
VRPPAASRLGETSLTLAAGLAASTPVIVATVDALRAGWVPVADRGIIATRAHDVFTSHMPLVGQYTLAGEVTGQVTHSLGPMLFWLLAVPAYLGSTAGMTLTMGVVNTLSILGCVALARRRGGRVLMVMTALAIALMCQSLAAETFHDIWNPSAGLFPFTLLIFLCWSLACGAYRLLPVTALVASFVAQTHLAYLPPALGLLAVGLCGLAAGGAVQRRRGVAAGVRRRRVLVWGCATALVAAACWSATVVGQLTEHPGNLTLVIESATNPKPTLGAAVGWHAVVRAVGIAPWWLRTPKSRWQRKYEVRSQPSTLATDSCLAILGALAIACLVGLLRRRRDLATLALIALVLCPSLAAVAASTPTPRVLSATLGYTMWWGSQAGMVAWLALAWMLWLALVKAVRRPWLARWSRRIAPIPSTTTSVPSSSPTPPAHAAGPRPAHSLRRPGAIASIALSVLALAALAAVGGAVAAQGGPDEHAVTYAPIRAIDAHLRALIPPGGSVLLEGRLDGATMPVKPAVRYFLVTRGIRVLAPGSFLRLGTWYELYKRPYREAIYLSDVPRPPVAHVSLAFDASFQEGSTRNTVFVWISRKPGR